MGNVDLTKKLIKKINKDINTTSIIIDNLVCNDDSIEVQHYKGRLNYMREILSYINYLESKKEN